MHLLQEESKDSDTKGQVQAIIDALDAQVAQWVIHYKLRAPTNSKYVGSSYKLWTNRQYPIQNYVQLQVHGPACRPGSTRAMARWPPPSGLIL